MRNLYFIIPIILLILAGCKPMEIKDGQVAYDLKKYNLATELLREDYNKAGDNATKAKIAYQIAESYRKTNNNTAAAEWYQRAYMDGYGMEANVWYAKMLQATEQYEAAIEEYQKMLKEEPFRRVEFASAITASEQALEWKKQPNYTTITNLAINSTKSDFSPTFYENKALIFASSREAATGEEADLWTGNKFYDLFIATRNPDGSFNEPEKFNTNLSSEYNDATVTFNKDFTEMYFTHCGSDDASKNDHCNIYYSERQPDGGWGQPVLIRLFQDSINVGHPVLSKDGNLLIYSAVDLQGYGGSDLYFSVRNFDGWSAPINLGSTINTPRNEAFPYLDEAGNLYFSSDGIPGMGGLDIFKAQNLGSNKWGNVQNLQYPINTGGDDFGVIIEPIAKNEQDVIELKGYLSSSRAGGKGGDDIYQFVKEKAPATYELIVKVQEKNLKDPDNPNSEVLGLKPLPNSQIVISKVTTSGSQTIDTATTALDGTVKFSVEANTDYKLFASKEPAYFSKSETVTTKDKKAKRGEKVTIQKEIVLDKIFESVEIEIPNIYYDYDKYNIRPDAAAVLDTTILPLLRENPTIKVEIGSHTDARGSAKYNQRLSQQRAEAVIQYLATKGINPERLQAKGYGESQPVNNCVDGVECSEEEYQRNRRTTFKVLSDKFDVQSVEPENIKVDPKKN